MSSKKAKRKKEFEEREKKRKAEKERQEILKHGNIEQMAKVLGIPLK